MIGKILGDVRYIAITAILAVSALLSVTTIINYTKNFPIRAPFLSVYLAALLGLLAIGALLVQMIMFHGEGNKLGIYAYCALQVLIPIIDFISSRKLGIFDTSASVMGIIFSIVPVIVIALLTTGNFEYKTPVFFGIVGFAIVATIFPTVLDLLNYGHFAFANLFSIIINAGVTASACMLAVDWD